MLVFVLWFYSFCHFGDDVANRYSGLADTIYDCPWHIYPLEFRQFVQMMMIDAQNTIYLEGFANVPCCREVFKKVSFMEN